MPPCEYWNREELYQEVWSTAMSTLAKKYGISSVGLAKKLGIVPERIEQGKPQQNGRHERLHRTLKAETARPPAGDRQCHSRRRRQARRRHCLQPGLPRLDD